MDYLTRGLRRLEKDKTFRYHPKCKRVGLINLCFADDMMLFCKGDVKSVQLVTGVFDDFSQVSGLCANKDKSQLICGGLTEATKIQLIQMTGYVEGKMPMRYLGVPLTASRLTVANCQSLIEKIMSRMNSWTAKYLTLAGRLLLIKVVLVGVQMYWSQIFPIPLTVINEMERLCRTYLWSGKATGRYVASVSWEEVCLPRKEGGLGMINLRQWNVAAKKDTMWVRWIQAYYLKNQCVWGVEGKHTDSWVWKRMLAIRDSMLEAVDVVQHQWRMGKFSIRSAYDHITIHMEKVGLG